MDGWSPGYLGSIAYNHNGMMRMYETQSGRDGGPGPAAATSPGGGGAPGAAPAAAGGGARAGGGGGGGRGGRGGAGGRAGGGAAAGAAQTGAAGGGTAAGAQAGEGARGAGAAGEAARGGGAGEQAGGEGRGAGAAGAGAQAAGVGGGRPGGPGGGRGGVPTGRGGGQEREWYRGIPIPPGAQANFTRRNNTNYMQTGVLSGLQLTAMFPNLVVENFYTKTRNSIEQGRTTAPFGYVIPVQRDMTKPTELVRILRVQGIEVGQTTAAVKIGDTSLPAGSFVIKGGQPYWRLAKNLLERQDYPDPALRTYDDSGWSMGHAFNVEVKEIRDKAVLDVAAPLI
jgi:hypothetical protein